MRRFMLEPPQMFGEGNFPPAPPENVSVEGGTFGEGNFPPAPPENVSVEGGTFGEGNFPPAPPENVSVEGGTFGEGNFPPAPPENVSLEGGTFSSADEFGGGTPPDSNGGSPPDSSGGNSSSSSSIVWSGATSITSGGTYSDQTYTSTTSDENAVLISTSDAVTISNPTVTKTGGPSNAGDNYSFYGINSAVMAKGGGTTYIVGGTVASSASGGNAVFSYGGNGGTNGAAGDGTTVYISGTTIYTYGDGSGGIMTTGGGKTVAQNLTVTTEGQSSAPIRTDRGGGTVSVSGGTYTSNGLGSPAIYSTAAVSVSGASLTSNLSEGVCIEGENSVYLTDCTLTANNTQTNGNAQFLDSVILYQSQSGDAADGTSIFSMTGGVINSNSGHVFHVTNTGAVINLSGVTINNSNSEGVLLSVCDDGWSGASNSATLNASNQTLSGDILVGDDSTLTLNLTDGSTFSGNVSGNISNASGDSISTAIGTLNVSLDSTSKWYLTGDAYVSSFSGDASNVITGSYNLYVNNSILSGTSTEDTISSGTDTLTSGTTLTADNETYTYSGGNATITSYETGEKLNYAASDLTDIDIFSDDDFVFSSSSGSLTIQNIRNEVIDFSYNGTTIAYLAKASGELTLDASGLSQFEILVGGDNASNNFSAGSGGSWLWGGVGGNDTLKGGTGADVFYFGKNDGSDVINNASSSDVVNLYDVSINDFASLDTSNNQITIGLNTGASLQINPAENVSAKITMQEGSVKFNHSTGQWNLV